MKLRAAEVAVLALVVVSFIIGFSFYDKMPPQMASHWNTKNEVDGYTSRFWGVFLLPFMTLGFGLLFIAIPRIDPLKQNIAQFRGYFESFIVLLFLFFVYIYLVTILWNLGRRFVLIQILAPALAILFFVAGVLMEHAKRNWFVGIRTPWTLSSEKVWDKTNKLGGRLFKIVGILCLGAIALPDYAIYFILVPILVVAVGAIVYSYVEYQREMRTEGESKR